MGADWVLVWGGGESAGIGKKKALLCGEDLGTKEEIVDYRFFGSSAGLAFLITSSISQISLDSALYS